MHCAACGTDERPVVRFTPNGVIEACGKCTAPVSVERPVANGAFLATASKQDDHDAHQDVAPAPAAPILSKKAFEKKPKDFVASARSRLVEVRRQIKALEKLKQEEAAICMMLSSLKELERQKAKH